MSQMISDGEKSRDGERQDLAAYKTQVQNMSANINFLRERMDKDRMQHSREKGGLMNEKRKVRIGVN